MQSPCETSLLLRLPFRSFVWYFVRFLCCFFCISESDCNMLSNTPGLRPSDYSFLTWTPDQPAKAGDQQTSCRWVPACDMGSPLTVSGTSQVLPWSKPPWVQANRPHSQQLYRRLGCLSHWNIKSSLWGIRIAPLLPFLLSSNHPVVLYHGNTWICNCNKGRNCHLFMAYNCIGNIYICRVTTKMSESSTPEANLHCQLCSCRRTEARTR